MKRILEGRMTLSQHGTISPPLRLCVKFSLSYSGFRFPVSGFLSALGPRLVCLAIGWAWLAAGAAPGAPLPSANTQTTVVSGAIQAALDDAVAGETIAIRGGLYFERLSFTRSGNASNGFITLASYPGETATISGRGLHDPANPHMIELADGVSYVRISGLNICSNRGNEADGGSGIKLEGAGHHIELLNNRIFKMREPHGMGITIYGADAAKPVSNLVVCGNEIFDCQPGWSEALTLNGNIRGFLVAGNYIHDVNNIGIDFIGGEWLPNVAREGVCSDNVVLRAHSTNEDSMAAGIYVDGGHHIVIERNWVGGCDVGIEIGAENAGWTVSNVTVRANVVFRNSKVGLGFGGYDASRGRVTGCSFVNNTFFKNANTSDWQGEIVIQWSSNNLIANNLVYASEQGNRYVLLDDANAGNQGNRFDRNLYFMDGPPTHLLFQWKGQEYIGFTNYQTAVDALSNELNSLYANPLLADAAASNLHVQAGSPAIDRGLAPAGGATGATDFDFRAIPINYRYDVGAFEYPFEDSIPTGAIGLGGGIVTTLWTAIPGGRYEIEAATELPPVAWAGIANLSAGTNAVESRAPISASPTSRFFRCRRLLP